MLYIYIYMGRIAGNKTVRNHHGSLISSCSNLANSPGKVLSFRSFAPRCHRYEEMPNQGLLGHRELPGQDLVLWNWITKIHPGDLQTRSTQSLSRHYEILLHIPVWHSNRSIRVCNQDWNQTLGWSWLPRGHFWVPRSGTTSLGAYQVLKSSLAIWAIWLPKKIAKLEVTTWKNMERCWWALHRRCERQKILPSNTDDTPRSGNVFQASHRPWSSIVSCGKELSSARTANKPTQQGSERNEVRSTRSLRHLPRQSCQKKDLQ